MAQKSENTSKNAKRVTPLGVDMAVDDRESDLSMKFTNANESALEAVTRKIDTREENILTMNHDMLGRDLGPSRGCRTLRSRNERDTIARLGPARRRRDLSS